MKGFSLAQKPSTTHLFLAEGDAEVGFMEAYLTQLEADASTTAILCYQGLSKIHGHSLTLAKLLEKEPGGLERIRGICLMADADDSPEGRVDLIIACAKAFGFPREAKNLREAGRCETNGRKFSFALSPALNRSGNIETLILGEIGGTILFKCIEESFPCIEREKKAAITSKARVQMYISAAANSNLAGVKHAFAKGIFKPDHASYAAARSMVDYVLR